jgi:hypothetical protein
MELTLSQQAKPSTEVLFQTVGDEAVLLDLSSENYFGLDPVGTRVWSLLSDDASLQRAFDRLLEEFEVEPDRLEADLLGLVAKLADAGLIVVD